MSVAVRRGIVPWLTLAALVIAVVPAYPQEQRKKLLKDALPEPPPTVELEFVLPPEGFPPVARGMANAKEVRSEPVRTQVTEALETSLKAAAILDARVRAALGERYAFIAASALEEAKEGRRDSAQTPATLLTFYNYARNIAVEVTMRDAKVNQVTDRPGYQPEEAPEEIKEAIDLARVDDRIRGAVRDLSGDAILMPTAVPPTQGRPEAVHRVFYVTFRKSGEDFAQYFAAVDLTTRKVLVAAQADAPPLPR